MQAAILQRATRSRAGSQRAIEFLLRRWQSERTVCMTLPPYENVALGNLGHFADSLALVVHDEGPQLRLGRVGKEFSAWAGRAGEGLSFADLRPDRARSLAEVVGRARESSEPSRVVTHSVIGGMIETVDLWALPVASLWGPPVYIVVLDRHAERHDLLDTMFGATDGGMLALSPIENERGECIDFQIIAFNQGAAALLRRSPQLLQWGRLSDLDLRLDETGVIEQLARAARAVEKRHFEATYPAAEGLRYFRIGVAPMGNLLSVTLTDIAEIKARERSFRLLFEGNPIPMWLLDRDSLAIVRVNDAAVRHYGYDRSRFIGMSALELTPAPLRAAARTFLETVDRPYYAEESWRHLTADGREIEVFPYVRLLEVEGQPAILVSVVDVTERRKAEERISYMAHHDALTDLPNRVLFRTSLEAALGRARRHAEPVAVLCLDLDHFKSVNDTLGHPVGDKLLQAVAERFRSSTREGDVVARLGGDEFAVIQTDIEGPGEVGALAARLIESISQPYDIDGHHVVIGTSIGIALAPADGLEPDALLKNADMALYRAKSDGRRVFRFFEVGMDEKLQARRALELDLRQAFAANEFELHYQPLVSVSRGHISGFEALLRWRHPERGTVSPAEFVPLAEEIGLIVQLGEWVLREACREAAGWPEHIKVAINLSPVQFRNDLLVETVADAISSAGIPPQRVELEITESVLLHDSEANLSTLRRLKGLGIQISMDDFGTGYSSLSYLQKFPFDKIKIDQSFVRSLSARPEAVAIVRALTGLGRSLDIATTAEGVESLEQFERLKSEGCTEVQGYLFSRPRPASELATLFAKDLCVPPGSNAATQADEADCDAA